MERTNLAGLPADIILQVLEYVANVWQMGSPGVISTISEDESLRAIQNVRLTCRALSQLATPLLFPILKVSINPRSLDAFEQLSKNPIIAARAQYVVVNLAVYSAKMAEDLEAFRKTRLEGINDRLRSLNWDMEFRLEEEGNEEDDDVVEYYRLIYALTLLEEGWERAGAIRSDSNNIQTESGAADEVTRGKYEDILLTSHNEYRRRRLEQLQCLSDAHTRLTSSFSRLACGEKLHFSAEVKRVLQSGAYEFELAELLDNPETLSRAMTRPCSWQNIQDEDGDSHVEMVRVLTALPIALADAGMPLMELYLGCFPHYVGFAQLGAHENQSAAELERELGGALQHLEIFDFGYQGMNCRGIRHNQLPAADMAYMRAYLQAAVGSPRLQILDLDFGSFNINDGKGRNDEDLFALGPVLRSYTSGRLTRMVLSDVQLTADELAPLLTRLGDNTLTFFYMYYVSLVEGEWAPLLDAVRDSTAQRCREGRCHSLLSRLWGGEFGNERPAVLDFTATQEERDAELREPDLTKKAQAYIQGKRETNPLRILGDSPAESSGDDD